MHDIIASGSAEGEAAGAGYYIGGGTDTKYGVDDTQGGGADEEEDHEVDPAEASAPPRTRVSGRARRLPRRPPRYVSNG
jgi:hypothetical protein